MGGEHPYRPDVGLAPDGVSEAPPGDAFEERLLATVLILAGLIGFVIGLFDPKAHPNELALGIVLASLGAWTLHRPRSRAPRPARMS